MKENIVAGLDIGSTAIRMVIGQKIELERGTELQAIGAVSVPAEGINKGVVTSIDAATASISDCLEKAERLVGVPITKVFVSVNMPNVRCEKSRGVIAIGKTNGEITDEDVERAIAAARALSVPPNYEIIHVIPIRYSVDNQGDIKDPVGMTGVRLEVEIIIIEALSSQISNITKAIYRTGLEIEDLVLAPLAAAQTVLTQKQKDLGAVLINVGATTTSMAVFEEGELFHAAIVPIGSEHITADIAIGLRCPINLAERIKIEYGSAKPDQFDRHANVDVKSLAADEGVAEDEVDEVSRHYLAEIIEARVEEIFEKIDEELRKIDRSGMLPAGAFIIGGGARLDGLLDIVKAKLRLPAAIGVNKVATAIIEKVSEPNYLTALGLVVWGSQNNVEKRSFGNSAGNAMGKVAGFAKSLFKKIKP
jgi:cell division protein FtsA